MSFTPAGENLIFAQVTVKAGDMIAATAVETNFASNATIPANFMQVGQVYRVLFRGVYSTPAVTPPTTTAKVKMNSTAIVATPALANPTGAAGLGYSGEVLITVTAIGTSGSVRAGGVLHFASSTTASVTVQIADTATTIDTTIAQVLQLSAQFSTNAATNSNTLQQIQVYQAGPVAASN